MMFEKIVLDTVVGRLVANAPGWLDQYGVFARPQTRRIETAPGQFTDKVYPVARYVAEEDCEMPGGLTNLNPDYQWRSLTLIEQVAGATFKNNPQIPQRRGLDFSVNIAIKVWLNYEKLEVNNQGVLNPRSVQPFAFDVIRILNGVKWSNQQVDVLFGDVAIQTGTLSKMTARLVSEIDHTPQAVFGAYSFAGDNGLMNGDDYGYFGFIFNLSGLLISDCGAEYGWEANEIAAC